jgi:hypothetical protein
VDGVALVTCPVAPGLAPVAPARLRIRRLPSMSTVTGVNTSATGRLLDELAGLLLPVVMPLVRRLPAIILVLAGLITLMGVLVLVGAHRDDAQIRAHSAVATAQVLPGSDFSRTLIAFTTANGETVSPEKGVFYPRGLQPGQIVRVEYDSTHPDRVRVLGRDASVGSWPIGLMVAITWAIALPVGFTLRGRQLRRLEGDRLAASIAAAAAAATPEGAGDGAGPDGSDPDGAGPGGADRGDAGEVDQAGSGTAPEFDSADVAGSAANGSAADGPAANGSAAANGSTADGPAANGSGLADSTAADRDGTGAGSSDNAPAKSAPASTDAA